MLGKPDNQKSVSNIRYLSVTEVNTVVNFCLESNFPAMHFEGEISEVQSAASGHIYLTLKDPTAQLSAVIWRSVASRIDFKIEKGKTVLCVAKPNVYVQRGRFQYVINKISLKGEGDLQRKFLELKEKLEKEGLFDQARKRELPFLPKSVGIVTSRHGAAIHDMLVKFKERMPSTKVYLVDARVQGEGAAEEIAAGIKLLNDFGEVEVVIIGRGGGSLEDLWAFNEEIVCRAIFASKVPVISAVGHEVDISLSDFVADVRAPTPTAAAEMVVPRSDELLARLTELAQRSSKYDRWIEPLFQDIDDLYMRLQRKVAGIFENAELKLTSMQARLSPRAAVEVLLEKINFSEGRLRYAVSQSIKNWQHQLAMLELRLTSLNPTEVMQRGFAIVEADGKLVKDAKQLKQGQELNLRFYKGSAAAEVKRIHG